ncbi:MAG: hypothetical protein ABIQ89_01060 [Candidatus Saccharimonadales bacterium]
MTQLLDSTIDNKERQNNPALLELLGARINHRRPAANRVKTALEAIERQFGETATPDLHVTPSPTLDIPSASVMSVGDIAAHAGLLDVKAQQDNVDRILAEIESQQLLGGNQDVLPENL